MGVSGCCRIDPIHHEGIYIPPLIPVLRAASLSLSLSLHPFWSSVSTSEPHRRGWFSPARPLMPPLSWERLRGIPLSPPPPPSPSLQPPEIPPSSSLPFSTMQRPLSTRQIFPSETIVRPIAMRSGRLHDFSNFRSYTIETIHDGNDSRGESRTQTRETRD